MAAPKKVFECSDCNNKSTKWAGQCSACKAWNTVEEVTNSTVTGMVGTKSGGTTTPSTPAQRIRDINVSNHKHKSTGIGELDRVLGGGLVAGGAILLAGPPGVGKALCLQTDIATSNGWKKLGELFVGDYVFGEDGKLTEIVALSEVWENRPCYRVELSDGTSIIADENHEWATTTFDERIKSAKSHRDMRQWIYTTKQIEESLIEQKYGRYPNHAILNSKPIENFENYDLQLDNEDLENTDGNGYRYIVNVERVRSVPVRCIEVDNESHLFLAGHSLVPTHNSSILAMVADMFAQTSNVLYVSGEESVQQIKLRHERMNALGENLYLAAESDLAKVLWHIDEVKPSLLIVDSLQTIASADSTSTAGSISQVTEVAKVITRIAKERAIPTIFVGHYTKDGNVAGPRVVEHLVDVVLSFEGEDDSPLRLLRGIKNRFGPSDEIGCFQHTETGLEEVPDPSGLLMGQREASIPGIATSIYLEGKRALPLEIQALVLTSPLPNPRKATSGLDVTKTIMLQAILQKHSDTSGNKVRLGDKDVYVSTRGNIRVKEPAVDLATIAALASDALGFPSRFDAVWIGEVSLSGEVTNVLGLARRLSEAIRLGFTIAMIPKDAKATLPPSIRNSDKIRLIEVNNVNKVISILAGFNTSIEAGIIK